MPRLADITERKDRLIARCAAQRTAIATTFHQLERPIAVVDRVLAVARFFRRHPLLIVAAVAVVSALKRRTLLGIVAQGVTAWRLWRSAGSWAHRLGLDFSRRRRRENAGHVAS